MPLCIIGRPASTLRHASAVQVQYGIIPGVYKHAATGMTRAYIQVCLHCFSAAIWHPAIHEPD